MVEDSTQVTTKEEEINASLIKLLKVSDPNNLPYRIRNQSEMLSNLSTITGTLTMLLAGIAGISLLV
jgi:putative ABC transport system permease protein